VEEGAVGNQCNVMYLQIFSNFICKTAKQTEANTKEVSNTGKLLKPLP
jgi:hypothetical protein